MPYVFIIGGMVAFAALALFTVVELFRIWRSDKGSKLEAMAMQMALFYLGSAVAGFCVYAGWVFTYPVVWTNGHPRRYTDPTTSWLGLTGLFLLLVAAASCPLIVWWMKKRRVKKAKSEPDLIWSALYAEYGWAEARRLFENYKRRMQDHEADE